MLNEAVITSPERLPDVEFVFSNNDLGQARGAPLICLDRRPENEELWLQPDFGFGSWPETKVNSFIEVRDQAALVDDSLTWADKTPRLFFRGAVWVNYEYRPDLVRISNEHPEWGDCTDLDWKSGKERVYG